MKGIFAKPEFIVRDGKPVSVILPLKTYEELVERLEDSDDVRWLKRAKQKPMAFRPLADYLAERKAIRRVPDPA